MAKKEVAQNRPVKVRAQTEEEIRNRLKKQGKIKDAPKKEEEGVRPLGEEEAQIKIEERKEREEQEADEENELVRPLNNKDIALRKAKVKEREANGEGKEEPNKVQTEQDIKNRTDPDSEDETEPEPESEPEPEEDADTTDPVEFFAKDVVSFEDDEGEIVTGKIKRVTAKGEAIIDTEDAEYTVPCVNLVKEKKEEK